MTFRELLYAVKNINKNVSAEICQIERETDLKPPEKPTDFPVWALQTCERATLARQKGHSRVATVALLQARLVLSRPVFGPEQVSTKFKRLTVSVLEMPPNFVHLRPEWVSAKNIASREAENG